MPSLRAPLAALAFALSLSAVPPALAAASITLEAPNGLSVLALTAAPGGGFAMVAQELVPYNGGTDGRLHVFRYDSDGNERWKRVIDRKGPQIAKAITYGPGEVLYIGGLDGSQITDNGYQSMVTAIGPSGEIITDTVFGEPFPVEDWISGIALAADGNLIAAQRYKPYPDKDADMKVVEVSPTGDVGWSVVVKQAANESYPMVATNAAGTFVAGTYENRRVFVSRVDEVGHKLDNFASFTTTKRCGVAQILALPDGGLVLAINLTGGETESEVVRLDSTGGVKWRTKMTGETSLADLTRLSDGMVVIAGTSDDPDTLETHAWLRAVDDTGLVVGEIAPDTQEETRAGGITRDGNDGVFFAYTMVDESIPAQPEPIIVERIRVQ